MEKNIKDSNTEVSISVKDMYFSVSYTKTHKLITALYMVTDIIDKEEPIRGKLRNLGAEIISDMHSIPIQAESKIAEIVSFLNIASAMSFISEMNCNILKKEFLELKESIQESLDMKPKWLADFFTNPPLLDKEGAGGGNTTLPFGHSSSTRRRGDPIGHKGHTRIGVQKGSTLMKALSDKTNFMSERDNVINPNKNNFTPHGTGGSNSGFDALKKQRRETIIKIIKDNGGKGSIKDILTKMSAGNLGGISMGEKTLQRELMSMSKDNILTKEGEKRWSRYSIRN